MCFGLKGTRNELLQAHKAKALRNRNTGNKKMHTVLIIRRKTKYAIRYLAKGKPSY
jgi:hypothetical protein